MFRHSADTSGNYLNDPLTTSTCVSCGLTGQGSSSTGLYCLDCPASEESGASVGCAGASRRPGTTRWWRRTSTEEPLRDATTGSYFARCVSCPDNTRLVGGACVGCDYPKVLNSGTGLCECPAGGAGGHCLDDDESSMISFLSSQLALSIPVSSVSRVSFYEASSTGLTQVTSTESHLFGSSLVPSAFRCLSEGARVPATNLPTSASSPSMTTLIWRANCTLPSWQKGRTPSTTRRTSSPALGGGLVCLGSTTSPPRTSTPR